MKKKISIWIASILCVSVAACGGLGTSDLDHAAGWRSATVVSIGRAEELAPTVSHACGLGSDPSARYAVVRYNDGSRRSRSIGTSRFPSDLAVGDAVHVNVLDCNVELRR